MNILQFLDYSTIHNTLSWKEHGNKPSESAVKSASNPNKAFENYLQTYGDQLYKEIEFLEDVNQDKDSKAKDKLLIQITNNSENHLSLDNIHPNFYKNSYLDKVIADYKQNQDSDLLDYPENNFNNIHSIDDPLEYEDFNVVDVLMAEPIWNDIEENVGSDDIQGLVTDITPHHHAAFGQFFLPEQQSNEISDAINSEDKATINNKKKHKSSHFSSTPEGSQPESVNEESNEIGNLRNEKYRLI